jgi:hypothetical protein
MADDIICTDRPTKSNLPCTVPAGYFQYEGDLFNWTDTRSGNTYLFTNPTFKYGLNSKADIELNIVPYEKVTGHNAPVLGGLGDMFARAKYTILNASDTSVTLLPYLKIPTAPPGIGNKAFEEGLIVPVSFNLPKGFVLLFDPEADDFKNAQSNSYHANYQGLVNVTHSLFSDNISVEAELWSDVNKDPAGTVTQASFDAAGQWLIKPSLQLDIGANIGLNRATPNLQSYVGISQLF